ncbi:MAG: sensor histidine kinase [Reichenbachiella sp.]|uniref:sensor histidine kinase n=1 Tax=Reichenbachiella sp. TaxID=2184521 RepID=UPI003264DD38
MKNVKIFLIHALAWVGYFNLIAWSFLSFQDWQESVTRALVIVSIHVFLFYLNGNLLMPKFLDKQKVITYVSLLLMSLGVVFVLLYGPLNSVMPERRPKFSQNLQKTDPAQQEIRPRIPNRRKRGWVDPRVIGILVSSAAALFVSAIYFNIRNKKSKDEEMLRLTNQSLEAEKKFLKSQINPHFLFNTLNNLYSLATVKSDKTADAIQQLSEILRYSIYDSESKLVTIQKELEYISHYIHLQSLKDEGYASKISLKAKEVNGQLQLPPMLLLPFIENAFKHGNLATAENGFIAIEVMSTENAVHFSCENSTSEQKQPKDRVGGIGLKNVRRRLELFYGESFALDIIRGSKSFRIKLILKT